ncbi:hypothetical protein HJA98_01570 [Rhizobium binae]|nr:hypothetical protein [Rhizobium binae]
MGLRDDLGTTSISGRLLFSARVSGAAEISADQRIALVGRGARMMTAIAIIKTVRALPSALPPGASSA